MTVFGAEAGGDRRDILLVAETLSKLPEKIREKVLEEAIFIVADGINGTVFNLSIERDLIKRLLSMKKLDLRKKDSSIKLSTIRELNAQISFILLNFANMRRKTKLTKMGTIAHEIAHFILGHGNLGEGEEQERMADDLAEEWGFKRAYRNYSIFQSKRRKQQKRE